MRIYDHRSRDHGAGQAAAPCLVDAGNRGEAPALEEIASEMDGRVTVAKMNIEENPMTPQKYGVRGIPTLMLFKDGAVAATKIGALPKKQLAEWVESVI